MVRYIYRIDKTDHITFVNPPWFEFARENSAPELADPSILGSSIWKFIEGAETRILYESLFSRLRATNNEVIVPFHCDSPTAIRKMELTLRSMPRGGIEFEGRLLETREREYTPILDRQVPRSEKEVVICSLCRRILVAQGEWNDPESALVRLRLFALPSMPRLTERVCPRCREQTNLGDTARPS